MKIVITKPKPTKEVFELEFDSSRLKIDENHEKIFYYDRLKKSSENDESACFLVDETQNKIEVLESSSVIVESIIKCLDNNINIAFWNHPAIFRLNTATKNFDDYLKLLSNSLSNEQQILLSTKNGEIFNVRPYDGKAEIQLRGKESFKYIPAQYRVTITETELIDIFNFLSQETCILNPTNIDVCITFQYVWDGCFARAHKMKQVMEQHFNVSCEKIFNYGHLAVNAYNYCVTWGWHVAPVVTVIKSNGTSDKYVIDPSVANKALTVDEWRNLQLNSCYSRARLDSKDIVDGRCYGRGYNGNYNDFDDDYSRTNTWLSNHRNSPTFE